MTDIIINRLVFDFSCRSEATARIVNDEMVNYGAYRINHILDHVLSEDKNDLIWKIDKLEIDLGNVDIESLGSGYIISSFEKQLAQSVEAHRRQVQTNAGADALVPLAEDQLAIIKSMLLYGDLPWWVDKKTFPDADGMLRHLIYSRSEGFRSFWQQHSADPDVIKRAKTAFSVNSMQLLNDLRDTGRENRKIYFKDLTAALLHTLQQSLINTEQWVMVAEIKLLLIEKLIRLHPQNILKLINAVNESSKISTDPNFLLTDDPRQAGLVLQQLNTLQLEMLVKWLQPQAWSKFTAEDHTDIYRKLWALLADTDINDLSSIQVPGASAAWQQQIHKLIADYNDSFRLRKKLIGLMARHPYITAGRILEMLTNLDFSGAQSDERSDNDQSVQAVKAAMQSAQKVLHQTTIQPGKEQRHTVDNTGDGSKKTSRSKAETEQLLSQLPDSSLQLISGLLQLSPDEIEKLTGIHKAEADNSGLNKTIVENAGLCLLALYLPGFFEHLGYTADGKFKTEAGKKRALYLLEYIVTGKQRNEEFTLQLNKLLCGIPLHQPAGRSKRLSVTEKTGADELLSAVIDNWAALKATTIKGFRKSFLQRKGVLTLKGTAWVLQVEKQSYDLLLDSLPWSFNLIKLPWMPKMISVEW